MQKRHEAKQRYPSIYYHSIIRKRLISHSFPVDVVTTSTTIKTTTTTTTTTPLPTTTPRLCPPGEKWVECAVPCNRTCHFFGHYLVSKNLCSSADGCLAGCQPEDWEPCPGGEWLRDAHTCVHKKDCTCRSNTGQLRLVLLLNFGCGLRS